VVTALKLSAEFVKDISPVRAFPGLTSLECSGRSPTRGLLSDLSPLKGTNLTALNCEWTQVADLSPLEGMPLTTFICSGALISDLSPLKRMPLTLLHCDNTPVADLSPLEGMP